MNRKWVLVQSPSESSEEIIFIWRKLIRLENGYDVFIYQATKTRIMPKGNYGYYDTKEAKENITVNGIV